MLGVVMGRIDSNEAGRRMRSAALIGLVLVVAGCGDDQGGPFVMPAGTEFDAVGSDQVIVVVETQNECADLGNCLPNPTSPCDLGDGNRRGLAVYRLGSSGRFVSATGDQAGALPEAIIPTGDNPRRVIAHPNDPTLLYVATLKSVQVFRLAAGGGSECLDQTTEDKVVAPDLDDDLEPVDLLIDPNFGTNGVLYIAGEEGHRVDAYDIALDGTLPDLPSSCIVGSTAEEFTALAVVDDTLFATGSRERIEVYQRVNGQFPDVQVTPTATAEPDPNEPTPMQTPMPTPTSTDPTPLATPSPAPTCIDALRITSPLSSLGAGRVTDIEFLAAEKPNEETVGSLVVAEEFTGRLTSFPIDPNGELDGDDDGQTDRTGFYQRLLRIDRVGTTFLYTTAFQEGETDVFRLGDPDDGEDRLPDRPLSRTRSDPFSLPVGLAIDGSTGSIMYVAQEGLQRIDGFRIRPDGGTDNEPVTSTAPARAIDGRALDLFPNDVVIVTLP